jgi:hypothetical protein
MMPFPSEQRQILRRYIEKRMRKSRIVAADGWFCFIRDRFFGSLGDKANFSTLLFN